MLLPEAYKLLYLEHSFPPWSLVPFLLHNGCSINMAWIKEVSMPVQQTDSWAHSTSEWLIYIRERENLGHLTLVLNTILQQNNYVLAGCDDSLNWDKEPPHQISKCTICYFSWSKTEFLDSLPPRVNLKNYIPAFFCFPCSKLCSVSSNWCCDWLHSDRMTRMFKNIWLVQ